MSETAFGAAPGPGAQLGGWTLSEPLGSGGIAAVFRATHVDGRQAALKVLHPASVGTDEVRRFQREYRALARLKHPNIVQVHEAGVADGYPWIAMELVAGQDLDATLRAWAEDDDKLTHHIVVASHQPPSPVASRGAGCLWRL